MSRFLSARVDIVVVSTDGNEHVELAMAEGENEVEFSRRVMRAIVSKVGSAKEKEET